MKAAIIKKYSKGYIDNTIVFFIIAILAAVVLFEIGEGQPIWVWITGGLIITALIVTGVMNMLFGFKGLGSNATFENKKKNKDNQD